MAGRIAAGAGGAALLIVAGGWAIARPDNALRVASGLAAHHICAATFTQGVDPEATFRELVKPMTGPAARLLQYRIDRPSKTVTASIRGLFGARAVWTLGYGCRLVFDPRIASPRPAQPRSPSAPDGFAPPTVVVPADPALRAAFDAEFADPASARPRRVKAVVIVKDGKVAAERYAPGFGVDTPLLSYSVAKSFTNAFLGVLVRQGRLRAEQPVGAPEWLSPSSSAGGDPRAKLTLEDLLRMRSGLDADETGSGFDPASRMGYAEDDMAAYAARHPLKRLSAPEWRYTSANTLILDRALGRAVGGGAASFRQFADTEVFQPLHMDGVTLEFDGAGTFSGSAHVYAPARAYARLGLMYLNDGMGPDGRRILPAGWAAWSRTSTLGSPYGAGFWTLDGPSQMATSLVRQGFPKDGYFASGNRGQRIYIVPSEHLVMTRNGYSGGEDLGIREDMKLLKAAITAFHKP